MKNMSRGDESFTSYSPENFTSNSKIINFLENNPVRDIHFENELKIDGNSVEAKNFHNFSLLNLEKICSSEKIAAKLTLKDLPVFSSTQFKAGRVNHAAKNWFKLLNTLDFDPRIETLQEILNSRLDLKRFFKPTLNTEISVGDKTIKWVYCKDKKPLPLLKSNGVWGPCHDLSIRRKQTIYQKELDAIILELVQCGIVHICGNIHDVDLSFFRIISPLHIVLEKRTDAKTGTFTTRLRATIDNKPFNSAFVPPSFFLLTGYEIQKSLHDFESASSFDLRKAFYNAIPTPDIQGYTGFRWRDFIACYSCSAFGLSISPYLNFLTTEFALQIYFRILKNSPFLRGNLNFLSTVYVDDFLIPNGSKNTRKKVLTHDKVFICLMASLGFTINSVKSDPIASNKFKFLGLHFNLDRKRKQLFTSPTNQQVENLKLNLAQLITAGNFQGLDNLENESFMKSSKNRARFFGSSLNHNLIEKVNGSILWMEMFHTFDAETFLIRKAAYFPYMLKNLNFQNGCKIQLWNFLFQFNFENLVNPSNFEKTFISFSKRDKLLEYINSLPDSSGPNFLQINLGLTELFFREKIMKWSKTDTQFLLVLSQAIQSKRSFFRAINFSIEFPEETLEDLSNFDLRIGATNIIFDNTNLFTKDMIFLFNSRFHTFERLKTASKFSVERISDKNLKAAWLKSNKPDSLLLVNSIPIGSRIANLQNEHPRKIITFFTSRKNLRAFCREVSTTSTIFEFKIPSEFFICSRISQFAQISAIFCKPK